MSIAAVFAAIVPLLAANAAVLPQADLAVQAMGSGTGPVGNTVLVPLVFHNYGPGTLAAGTFDYEVLAPGGTVIPNFDRAVSPTRCVIYIPGRHFRCHSLAMSYPDYDQPSGVDGGLPFYVSLEIKAKCTTPGRYTMHYAADPKSSNNSAPLRVTVEGVPASQCQPPATKTPAPKPSTPKPSAPKPSATSTPGTSPATATPARSASPQATETSTPDPVLAPQATTPAAPSPAAIATVVTAAAAGIGVATVVLLRRRRPRN